MTIDLSTLSRGAVWLRAKDTGANGSDVTQWVDRLGLHDAISSSTPPKVKTNATILGGKAVKFSGASILNLGEVLKDNVTASASSTYPYGSYYSPNKALDGLNGSYSWTSHYSYSFPHWWQLTFSSPKTLTKYAIEASSSFTWTITAWELRGSNDNFSTFDVLDTRSDVVWSETYPRMVHEYSFANTTPYLAYRLHITANNGSGDDQVSIGEFLYGETVLGDVDSSSDSYEAWVVVKAIPHPYGQPNGLWSWSSSNSGYSAYPSEPGPYFYLYEQFVANNYLYSYHDAYSPQVTNNWRVYRVVYDNNMLRFFLDGVQETYAYVDGKALTNNVRVGISRFGYSSQYYFHGEIAELYARNKVSSEETAEQILKYLQSEHIYATVTGRAPVLVKSRYNVGVVPELTGSAAVAVGSSDFSIEASTVTSTAPVDIHSESLMIAELFGTDKILIPIELSGNLDPLLPPPVPPVNFAGLPDPMVAPTLVASNTDSGHLQSSRTYRYSYAGWKGTPSQATAPSPTADITLGAGQDTVTLTYPTIEGADGYLVYREDL